MKRPAKPIRFGIVIAIVGFVLGSIIWLAFSINWLALIRSIRLKSIWLITHVTPGDLLNSATTFVATIISVILAFFVGLALYRRQVRMADAKRREELREALLAELDATISDLKDPKSFWAQPQTALEGPAVPITYLQAVILEDAARSGLFDTKSTNKMLSLIRLVDVYNLRISQLITIGSTGIPGGVNTLPAYQGQLNNLLKHIDNSKQTIIDEAENLTEMIKSGDHAWLQRLIGW